MKHLRNLDQNAAGGLLQRRLSPVSKKSDSERVQMPKNPLSIQRQLDILKGIRSDLKCENECEIDSEDGRGLRNLLKR